MPWSSEQKRKWRKDNMTSDLYHAQNIKHGYGLTKEQYNEMFVSQQGCCAICGRHQSSFKRRLHVDHCHTTNKIRGLLCASCNSALGKLQDSTDVLRSAISYLERVNV